MLVNHKCSRLLADTCVLAPKRAPALKARAFWRQNARASSFDSMAGTSSDGHVTGMESCAIEVLTRAVELDRQRRFTDATVCYQEGLQLLMNVIKATTNEAKKVALREKALQYMDRAEKIKEQAQQQQAVGQHEQIKIENNSSGFGYETVFGRFLDDDVTTVQIDDAYIRAQHQIYNFLRFCELLVKSCHNLKLIKLRTTTDLATSKQQHDCFAELTNSLRKRNIQLVIELSHTLHDREIRFDNGWVIKIGRGLDYFKPSEGKFSIGYCDYDLRSCHETAIDIFNNKHLRVNVK